MKNLFQYLVIFILYCGNIHSHHPGDTVEISEPYPEIFISIYEDSSDGYNIKIHVKNFKFTPEEITYVPKENEGYAVVYVNEIPIGRSYSEWFHIPDRFFNLVENEIKVAIKNVNHQGLVADHKIISQKIIVKK